MKSWNVITGILALMLALSACDEGQKLENLAPETRLFLDTIELSGGNRLNSAIRMYWSGDDADGYIVGYEISLNQSPWFFTRLTDSLFRFDITGGIDTTDIDFRVRAIDNEGLADLSPATLRVPIKNSPPIARFDTVNALPDTVYAVASVLFSVTDNDGAETLDSVFVKVNDGAWQSIDRFTTFLSFVANDPKLAGSQQAKMYRGVESRLQTATLSDWNVGGQNILYLQARDVAGSWSRVDSTPSFFVKRQTSDFLVIDEHSDNTAEGVYFAAFAQLGQTFDYLNLPKNLFNFWDPSLTQTLDLYDKVFWYSDGASYLKYGQLLLLEVAASPLQRYLNNGGKLIVSARFPTTFNDPQTGSNSAIFSFSPMDSLSSSTGQARILANSLVSPAQPGLDTLVCSSFITGADPFYAKNTLDNVFIAQVTPVGGWQGPSTICSSSRYSNGRINQIFWSVELHKLNGSPDALSQFFDWALNDAFNW